MSVQKVIILLSVFFIFFLNCGAQSFQKDSIVNLKYSHHIFKFNEKELKITSYSNGVIAYGFCVNDSMRMQMIDPYEKKEPYWLTIKYDLEPKVDTINTVLWFNSELPVSFIDSALFYKKMEYALALYSCNEKLLSIGNVPKFRMLTCVDRNYAEMIWNVESVYFYPDSAIINEKKMQLLSDNQLRTTSQSMAMKLNRKLKEKKRLNLLSQLQKIVQYKGYEYDYSDFFDYKFNKKYMNHINYSEDSYINNSYMVLIEYFDGKSTHTFIMPPAYSLKNKELVQIYTNILNCISVYKLY